MRLASLVMAVVAGLAVAPVAGAWTWPVDGPVLRPFVLGDDAYAGGQHRGVDVGAAAGDVVRAPVAGYVSFAGTLPRYGHVVTLRAGGYAVTLLHLGDLAVARNAEVAEGQPVALVGPTGELEHAAPYVHLGVRNADDDKGYVDPLTLLPARPEAAEPEPAPAAAEPQPAVAAEPAPVAAPAPPAAVPVEPSPPPAAEPVASAPAEQVTATADCHGHGRRRAGAGSIRGSRGSGAGAPARSAVSTEEKEPGDSTDASARSRRGSRGRSRPAAAGTGRPDRRARARRAGTAPASPGRRPSRRSPRPGVARRARGRPGRLDDAWHAAERRWATPRGRRSGGAGSAPGPRWSSAPETGGPCGERAVPARPASRAGTAMLPTDRVTHVGLPSRQAAAQPAGVRPHAGARACRPECHPAPAAHACGAGAGRP